MVTLAPTDTLEDVAAKLDAAADEARIERIRAAKTNMQYLMAAGVIVTCDDEYEKAMVHAGQEERAKAAGRPFHEQAALETKHKRLHAARDYCAKIVLAGEAPHERAARRAAILAQAGGLLPSGRKCRHQTTRKHQGWVDVCEVKETYIWHDASGREHTFGPHPDGLACFRCGAFVSDAELARTGEPTDEAKAAAAILHAAGPAVFDCVVGGHRQGAKVNCKVLALSDHDAKEYLRGLIRNPAAWYAAHPAPFDAEPADCRLVVPLAS